MKIIFCDTNPVMVEAFRKYFGSTNEVIHGSILDLQVDAIVSPANSFGFMDGGIDLIYSQYFGWDIQRRLQEKIKSKHHGELLVGQVEWIETNNSKIPYILSAPTMRVPLDVRGSVNAYLATKAVLNLINFGYMIEEDEVMCKDVFKTIAFPGLCTGVGSMPPEVCAYQMKQAIDGIEFPKSWFEAKNIHNYLAHIID